MLIDWNSVTDKHGASRGVVRKNSATTACTGETYDATIGSDRNAPERIRTSDLRFRKPLLYPAELRAHDGVSGISTECRAITQRTRNIVAS